MGNHRPKGPVILKPSVIGNNGKITGRHERKPDGVTMWVFRAIDLMKAGYSSRYIFSYVQENKKKGNSTGTINQIIGNASQILNNEYSQRVKDVQVIHVRRYNDNINRLLKTKELPYRGVPDREYDYETFLDARNMKIKAFNDALNSIMQKENCLQMNSSTFTIEINEETTVNVKEEKPNFNVSKLTFAEQIELYELMRSARQGDNELSSVIERAQEANGQVTEDVVAVIDTPANVSQIKQERLEVIEEKPAFVVDPTAKLRETLRKLAAGKLKGIGAHLDPTETKLLEVKK